MLTLLPCQPQALGGCITGHGARRRQPRNGRGGRGAARHGIKAAQDGSRHLRACVSAMCIGNEG